MPLIDTPVPFFARRSMAAVAAGSDIFFFGGVGAAGTESILDVSADLWRFNTATLAWREIQQAGPWPSPRRCVGFVNQGGKLLLWGGSGINGEPGAGVRHNFLNDLWRFDLSQERWELMFESEDHTEMPLRGDWPFPRYTPVFQPVGERLFLFGGYTEDCLGKRKLNDVWLNTGDHWRIIPIETYPGYGNGATWPGVRYGCMAAADERYVYICGGFSDDGDHIDVWRFDTVLEKWKMLSPDMVALDAPASRYCGACAWFGDRLFLFGGRSRRDPKRNFNDLWCFDLISRKWSCLGLNREPKQYDPKASFPGYHAKSASAKVGRYWYIWGGEGRHGHVSDLWRLNLETLDWELVQPARCDDPIFW